MPIRASESRQRGSIYVEAAFSLPIFLGILYVTIFFSVLTYRQMAVQFVASRVSEVVRVCLARTNSRTCTISSERGTARSTALQSAQSLIGTNLNLEVYLCSPSCEKSTSSTGSTWRPGQNSVTSAGAGELYHVVVTVPTPKLFGGTVPFFGIAENHTLEGSVLGVFEKGSGAKGQL